MKEKIKRPLLISACILGLGCRYDGASKPADEALIKALGEKYSLIPVCPEIYGGLPTPRPSCERRGDRVISSDGREATENYRKGAEETLCLAKILGAECAVLKQKSPSCGSRLIYDGSFTRRLIPGMGITAQLLSEEGLEIFDENDIPKLIERENI